MGTSNITQEPQIDINSDLGMSSRYIVTPIMEDIAVGCCICVCPRDTTY